jgi:hypothetical protein
MNWLRALYRLYTGRCIECGADPQEPERIETEADTPVKFCGTCGGPHIIWSRLRCPCCGALLDEGEELYAEYQETY